MPDPVRFLERHDNVGDSHADETRRMIKARRQRLAEARQRQRKRRERMEKAHKQLIAEIDATVIPFTPATDCASVG